MTAQYRVTVERVGGKTTNGQVPPYIKILDLNFGTELMLAQLNDLCSVTMIVHSDKFAVTLGTMSGENIKV